MVTDQQILQKALREDLYAFIIQAFRTVNPGTEYLPNWHIEAIAHALETNGVDTGRRLLITQPPRSLKSLCASVAYPAWVLGHNPSLEFICVSYSTELAAEFARQFRMVVESDWYRRAFPAMCPDKNTATEFVTTKGGGRYATSVGGSLTGFGADVIIIDDPLKADEASSEAARSKVNEWYGGTLVTRLNDKARGAIITVMQRLHEDDLASQVSAQPDCHHLDLPAIALGDQAIALGPGSNDVHHRKEGEALHPERESLATLARIKSDIGSLAFSAQYQQQPVPLEGNLVKREWFKTYKTLPDFGQGARIVQSWDIAATATDRSDYSVCTTWALKGKDSYLIDVWRGRLKFPELKRKVIALQEFHGARTVLIEKAGLGLNLFQELLNNSPVSFPCPIGITPKGDKLNRMDAGTATIENGQIILPEDAPWLDEFLHEILAFPNGRYDDQVDSLSQFLAWMTKKPHRPGISTVPPEVIYGDDIDE